MPLDDIFRLPGGVRRDAAVQAWLDRQPGELGALARFWFARFRDRVDDVLELMHDGCPTACVGDVAFGYVAVYTAHLNVGFFFGAELPDPTRLLEGSGKRMRHVKVRPGREPDAAALTALIDAAYRDVKARV